MSELPYKIINGDSLKVLDTFEENSIDSIVTDPPYGLTTITKRFGKENSAPCQEGKDGSFARLSKGFMGKEWDGSGIEYNVELWRKAWRVLKPGGYLLAFGGTRTFHRIACAIEDAGFEIRDTIMWLYGSGFPKSHNIGLGIDKLKGQPNRGHRVSTASRYHPDGTFEPNGEKLPAYEAKTKEAKQWAGWGTALKPSYEPVIVARKPIEGTVAKNCLKYGVGGINIDECRVGDETGTGRFPANTILTYDETDYGEVCGGMPESGNGNGGEPYNYSGKEYNNKDSSMFNGDKPQTNSNYNDNGSASRYFYNAKASKKDRDDGLLLFEEKQTTDGSVRSNSETGRIFGANSALRKNIHPTVKPSELMQYLVRLVTPKGGTVLDIFNGSGSTGKACMFENRERNANYKYIGIELDPEYCKISEARIDYALNKFQYDVLEAIKENEEKGQLSLFSDYDD